METVWYKSPIGIFIIKEHDGKITQANLARNENEYEEFAEAGASSNPVLKKCVRELEEYFEGVRTSFDLSLAPQGTAFQKQVWRALTQIPYAETRSYKQIAEMTGRPKAARAVGGACNKNHIIILIPCHRVVASDGSLCGFGCGLDVKEKLLGVEKDHVC